MGCDYYESENIEYTYSIGDMSFTKDVEISLNRMWVYADEKNYEEEIEMKK